jgi:hypothetical protein
MGQASFNALTATIETDYKGATPSVDYLDAPYLQQQCGTDKGVLLNLSRHNAKLISTFGGNPLGDTDLTMAIRLTGKVVAAAVSEEALKADWEFHFMQFFSLMQCSAHFAGATSSDGSMFLDFAGPSYFAGYRKFVLDADPTKFDKKTRDLWPYSESTRDSHTYYTAPGQWQPMVTFPDHPAALMPRFIANPAAGNKRNYLIYVGYQYRVVTTLVAQDQNSYQIQPLCWVEWRNFLTAGFHWRTQSGGQTDTPDGQNLGMNLFRVEKPVQGVPPYADIAALIKNPPSSGSGTYNEMANKASARPRSDPPVLSKNDPGGG